MGYQNDWLPIGGQSLFQDLKLDCMDEKRHYKGSSRSNFA